MQTLVPILEAAHGGWLRGVLPARVKGVLGHNDVVVFKRKDGSYVLNEGAEIYNLPVANLSYTPGKILSEQKVANGTGSYALYDTESVRLVTAQGNEVDLHRLKVGDASTHLIRGRNDDSAFLAGAGDSLDIKKVALERLIDRRESELKELCQESGSPSVGSVDKFLGGVLPALSSVTTPTDVQSKKRMAEEAIKEFKVQQEANKAEVQRIQKLASQLQTPNAALKSVKIMKPGLAPAEMESVLAEVITEFTAKMADKDVSDTDRDEIKRYCGDQVTLPERKLTTSENLSRAVCENLSGPQKDLCLKAIK